MALKLRSARGIIMAVTLAVASFGGIAAAQAQYYYHGHHYHHRHYVRGYNNHRGYYRYY